MTDVNGKLDMLIDQTGRIETKVDQNTRIVVATDTRLLEHLKFSERLNNRVRDNTVKIAKNNGMPQVSYKLIGGMIGITATLAGLVVKLIP